MNLLNCLVKQFTLQVSPGMDATCPLGRSEQLSYMADGGAKEIVVRFAASASVKLLQNLQSQPSQCSCLKAPKRMTLDKSASPGA